MIISQNITKSYGDLKVLKGINLEIKKKEVISIVGPSGAGKSTFLQILGTLGKPDSGYISIEGVSVFELNSAKLAKFRNKHIGFVFQFHHLLPEFTALENVCIPGYIAKTNKQQVQNRAKELLDFLNLSNRIHHKPEELSGGEQQRVAVARAIINNPDIILADEPSGNLDTQNKTELHNLFFKLREELGQTIIIVTHDEGLANMSDRKLTMVDGLIVD